MGLPVNKLICASNENNVLTDFIETGVYDRNRQFKTTISPSMDILISSNLERLLFIATDGVDKLVANWMDSLKNSGKYEVTETVKARIKETFVAGCCSDAETLAEIKRVEVDTSYVMDTHTAVAKKVYEDYKKATDDATKTVIVSTASPFKFADSVLSAIKDEITSENEFQMLDELSKAANAEVPKPLASLESKPVIFTTTCEKDEMYDVVSQMLNLA